MKYDKPPIDENGSTPNGFYWYEPIGDDDPLAHWNINAPVVLQVWEEQALIPGVDEGKYAFIINRAHDELPGRWSERILPPGEEQSVQALLRERDEEIERLQRRIKYLENRPADKILRSIRHILIEARECRFFNNDMQRMLNVLEGMNDGE